MRVLVCGGRNFDDKPLMEKVLNDFKPTHIIQGAAKGADSMAGEYAARHDIKQSIFPADWGKYGKGAGHIRNQQMLDEGKPDLVVAFPGGKGTANMIERTRAAGVDLYIVTGE
jgi:hypothetical protein